MLTNFINDIKLDETSKLKSHSDIFLSKIANFGLNSLFLLIATIIIQEKKNCKLTTKSHLIK